MNASTFRVWPLIVAATAVLAITTGIRQSLGLFVQPLASDTALGIAEISFALAIGQLMWGVSQPLFGAWADQHGPGRALLVGGLMMAIGLAVAPFWLTSTGLIVSLGVLSAAGAGAGSFSVLLAATTRHVPTHRRSMVAGVVNAGGSFGQFVFAPLTQAFISLWGWAVALWSLAIATLASLPLAWPLRGRRQKDATAAETPAVANAGIGLRQQLAIALRDRSYACLHIGFFTCGFHIAFLVTHLPTEIALCGLPESVSATSLALIGLFNIAGSLGMGWLGQRYRMKWLLVWLYASRALLIALYLMMPATALTFFIFSATLGMTWLATVPPTAGLVGKLFGPRYLATLFGLTLLSHQIGGFFGAWLGGVAMAQTGSYLWIWYIDLALAAIAALAHLPIREAAPDPRPALAPTQHPA